MPMARLGKERGQVSLETVAATIAALTLLLGSIRLFFWINERLVTREEAYDTLQGHAVNEQGLANLHLLNQ